LAIAVGLVGLVLSASVAAAGSPSSAEIAVFQWFNDPPGALGAVMRLVNPLLRPVGLTMLIGTVIVLLTLTRRDVFWPLATSATAAGTLAYLIDNVVKFVVDRGRPPAYLSDVLYHGYPIDPRGTGYPSSHTAVTVGVIVGAWPWLNRPWRVGGIVAAAAIGLNRMYVGAHFPLDVLGGLAVGLVAGGIVLVVAHWLSRRVDPSTHPNATGVHKRGSELKSGQICDAGSENSDERAE
jgi:membrane-associated phospholipid phosphatase